MLTLAVEKGTLIYLHRLLFFLNLNPVIFNSRLNLLAEHFAFIGAV
jgi:hypothetical protein